MRERGRVSKYTVPQQQQQQQHTSDAGWPYLILLFTKLCRAMTDRTSDAMYMTCVQPHKHARVSVTTTAFHATFLHSYWLLTKCRSLVLPNMDFTSDSTFRLGSRLVMVCMLFRI